jgi:hypothetical protein
MKMLLVGIVRQVLFKSLTTRTRSRLIVAKNVQIQPIQRDKQNLKVYNSLKNVMNVLLVPM